MIPNSSTPTTFDKYDAVLTALAIWREARGEEATARRGVYWVIHNRTTDAKNRWPKKHVDVILQPSQFSSFHSPDRNASLIPDTSNGAFMECCAIVDAPGADPTWGANAYHSYPAGSQFLPTWAEASKLTVHIGAFSFYRL